MANDHVKVIAGLAKNTSDRPKTIPDRSKKTPDDPKIIPGHIKVTYGYWAAIKRGSGFSKAFTFAV